MGRLKLSKLIKCENFLNFFKNTPTNSLKLSNNSEGVFQSVRICIKACLELIAYNV